jgi:4-hydroxy-4-methyl-2-oxoglutarate aldolase
MGGLVQIGEVRVETGDTVLGDADGVVVVRANELAAVTEAARIRAEHEREILHRLAGGASTLELLDLPASSAWRSSTPGAGDPRPGQSR